MLEPMRTRSSSDFPAATHRRIDWLLVAIIGIGVLLRLVPYLYNRSFWMDEAALANAVLGTPLWSLHHKLFNTQVAPLGFLMGAKLSSLVLGEGERALRLLPFLASLVSLPLVYLLARMTLGGRAALAATGLLAVNPTLIQYAVEFKPYGPDAVVTMVVIAMSAWYRQRPTAGRLAAWTAICAASCWFSFPAMFVIGGALAVLALERLLSRNRNGIGGIAIAAAAMAAAALAVKLIHLDAIRGDAGLAAYWSQSYAPLPLSASGLEWYLEFPFEFMKYPGGFVFAGLAAFVLLVGVLQLWRKEKWTAALLLSPVSVAFCASLFHVYPIEGRLGLFLAPVLIVLVGAGLDALIGMLAGHRAVAALLVIMVFLFPVSEAVRRVRCPAADENLRPVVKSVLARKAASDRLLVYSGAAPAFAYYARMFSYTGEWKSFSAPRSKWAEYDSVVCALLRADTTGAWLIFSHVWTESGIDEEKYIAACADRCAIRAGHVHAFAGATAYRYVPGAPR